ncbi:MAG: hypothetical protein KDD28_33895, partial [Phaeodactylibacter sp.]|nr:hypothetical protein [Phaeodactylibacter sp.]
RQFVQSPKWFNGSNGSMAPRKGPQPTIQPFNHLTIPSSSSAANNLAIQPFNHSLHPPTNQRD